MMPFPLQFPLSLLSTHLTFPLSVFLCLLSNSYSLYISVLHTVIFLSPRHALVSLEREEGNTLYLYKRIEDEQEEKNEHRGS